MIGGVGTSVQTLYYVFGIVFMLGGAVTGYVEPLQGRIGKQERDLGDYKIYVAERYARGILERVEAGNP